MIAFNPYNGHKREYSEGFSFPVLIFGPMVPLSKGHFGGAVKVGIMNGVLFWLAFIAGFIIFAKTGLMVAPVLLIASAVPSACLYNGWHRAWLDRKGYTFPD